METDTTNATTGTAPPERPRLPDWDTPRTLVRPLEGRMFAGVAAGIADYLAVEVTIVRILLVVLCFVGGAGLPLYLAGWLLIPEQGSEHPIAADLLQSRRDR